MFVPELQPTPSKSHSVTGLRGLSVHEVMEQGEQRVGVEWLTEWFVCPGVANPAGKSHTVTRHSRGSVFTRFHSQASRGWGYSALEWFVCPRVAPSVGKSQPVTQHSRASMFTRLWPEGNTGWNSDLLGSVSQATAGSLHRALKSPAGHSTLRSFSVPLRLNVHEDFGLREARVGIYGGCFSQCPPFPVFCGRRWSVAGGGSRVDGLVPFCVLSGWVCLSV